MTALMQRLGLSGSADHHRGQRQDQARPREVCREQTVGR